MNNNISLTINSFTASNYKQCFSQNKILLYFIGMLVIIVLGQILKLPDWDMYLSIIMPSLTFLTAGITTGKLINAYINQDKRLIAYMLLWLITFIVNVDLVYVIYNEFMHHIYFRIANFIGSSTLYILCCAIFSYKEKS